MRDRDGNENVANPGPVSSVYSFLKINNKIKIVRIFYILIRTRFPTLSPVGGHV